MATAGGAVGFRRSFTAFPVPFYVRTYVRTPSTTPGINLETFPYRRRI